MKAEYDDHTLATTGHERNPLDLTRRESIQCTLSILGMSFGFAFVVWIGAELLRRLI